jgi:hypothetical protein
MTCLALKGRKEGRKEEAFQVVMRVSGNDEERTPG